MIIVMNTDVSDIKTFQFENKDRVDIAKIWCQMVQISGRFWQIFLY